MKAYHLFLFAFILSCNANNKKERINPTVRHITESVYASATIKPEFSYYSNPPVSGIIREIFVEEGQLVKKGQALFKISTTADVNSNLTYAELNLIEAKKNYQGDDNLLLNIELELEVVEAQLASDSLNYKRQEKLRAKDIGSKTDLEKAELQYQSTLSKYKILQKKYAQTRTNLETNYKKALSNAAAQRSLVKDFVITSKIDGKVYSITKEEGELITTQEQFAEVGSADNFIIEMDIDEVDIVKIEPGDTVTIILDAYPGKVFTAGISKISQKIDDATQTFRVEGRFVTKPPKLYNGLSGEANIIVGNRENALIIPSEYLLDGNKVLTKSGELPVIVGIKNLKYVEIISGIDSTTLLIKPD